MPESQTYRIAWIGPDVGDCQYLLERFVDACRLSDFEPDIRRSNLLELEQVADRDRIVLVSNNRTDYPEEAVELLTTSTNIVPWAVVTGSWHIGSRRSGQGVVTHWQQPWFRWWDCWAGWFFPSLSRPGSIMPSAYAPVIAPLDYALPAYHPSIRDCQRKVALIVGCSQTADMLRRQSQHAGWTVEAYRSLAEFMAASFKSTDAVVWDDSLLPCLPDQHLVDSVNELVCQLTKFVPSSQLIASLDLEHLCLWPELRRRGCVDLLVKPSPALGLSNCLYARQQVGRGFRPVPYAAP